MSTRLSPACLPVSHFEMAEWRLTPSLRVAAFSHYNKHGAEVLVETDQRTKLCVHGETGSTIRNWVQAEARAKAGGCEAPRRPSLCDCTHTHGLQNHTYARTPTPPASVYELLAAQSSPRLDIGEAEPALQMGALDVYLGADGSLYCAHGHLLDTRSQAHRPCVVRARGPSQTCGCQIHLLRRVPHIPLSVPRPVAVPP